MLRAQQLPGSHHPDRAVNLVLYSRDGVCVAPLVEGRDLVVGRFPPADLPVRDPSLSRQHASFSRVGDEVWVEDLDSTNGTWVNGERVERSQVLPGDTVTLGMVLGAVLVLLPGEQSRLGLVSHDVFLRELALELARASCFKRSSSLLMLRPEKAGPPSVQRWVQLRDRLRPFDRVGLYSRDTLEVLLPEADAGAAREAAERLLELLPDYAISTATYPRDAGSAGELFAVARDTLRLANAGVVQPVSDALGVRPIVGDDSACPVIEHTEMRRVFEMAHLLSSSAIPVLLLGETGVGKEVVARAIHEGGARRNLPMVCVNCGSIPGQLVESTLFGHVKGAFTGALQQAKGVFETAGGGTVFLDEIGELPLPAQVALLRVLETKKIARVGSPTEIEVNARVVAATHCDLEQMAGQGSFRRDLLYRLNAMTLRIPPLRDRSNEIELLARRFLDSACRSNGRDVSRIAPEALDVLRRYAWPGNVRELRNAMERAVVIAHGEQVSVDDLPEALRQVASEPQGSSAPDQTPTSARPMPAVINLRAELQRYETELILRALKTTSWRRQESAELLGLPLRTLTHRMNLLGIRRAD